MHSCENFFPFFHHPLKKIISKAIRQKLFLMLRLLFSNDGVDKKTDLLENALSIFFFERNSKYEFIQKLVTQ